MSVLIKDMKMPNACYECEFYNAVCPFDGVGVWYDPLRERADGCPLLEVPNHGDLIDRDAWRKSLDDVCYAIENAPVVIPADRSIDKDKDVLCKSAEKSEEECEDENWYTELDDPKIAERSEE